LKNSHLIGIARVYHYSSGGKGNGGGVWVDHVLELNGKSYKASSLYTTSEITSEGLNQMMNRTFPVVYNPSNPSNSHLMLSPSDFRKWGYTFPDSLRWLLPYIKND
jgi:hypothetical protein